MVIFFFKLIDIVTLFNFTPCSRRINPKVKFKVYIFKIVHVYHIVRVIEAKNLPKKDLFGKSDPYCIVKVGGTSKKTKIIKKTLDPYWWEYNVIIVTQKRNETFIMPVLNPNNEMILFELYDWDFGINRDDFM